MSDQEHPEPELFSEWIEQFKGGQLDVELMMMMREVTTAARAVKRSGSISLTLKIAPDDAARVIFITESVGAKVPEETRTREIFFATDTGTPVKHDPTQDALPFGKDVNTKETEQ